MNIKSHWDLQLRDLPFIEGPFFARTCATKLASGPSNNVPKDPSGREMSVEQLQKALEHGQLGAFGLNDTMNERRAGERHLALKNAQRPLSLPLGASALVAPLTPSASVTDEVTPGKEKRKPVHLEVGIFTDGTLNNAGNIDLFRDRVESECLTPHQNGEIDDTECEHRLSLLLGDSYANGTSNIAKLWNLYPEAKNETESALTQSFPIYAPGAGSKTGANDSLKGMATGLGGTGMARKCDRPISRLI